MMNFQTHNLNVVMPKRSVGGRLHFHAARVGSVRLVYWFTGTGADNSLIKDRSWSGAGHDRSRIKTGPPPPLRVTGTIPHTHTITHWGMKPSLLIKPWRFILRGNINWLFYANAVLGQWGEDWWCREMRDIITWELSSTNPLKYKKLVNVCW